MKEFKQFLKRKTSIAAMMLKLLVKELPDKKILAIDADPAVGLATALGVEVSLTIDDIRKNVVEAAEEGSAQQAVEMLGEAGIEQINRRVMEKVTHLLLITDSSRKGTQVIQSIHQVATDLVMYEKIGVIANRLPDLSVLSFMNVGELPVVATITSDKNLAEFDLKGENVFFLSDDSKIVEGTRTALENIGIMRG